MGLSTHVLDTGLGQPAAGVPVRVEGMRDEVWAVLHEAVTDADGRCAPLLREPIAVGVYRLHFETRTYFTDQKVVSLYPFVEVVFEVKDARHYHIPLLISANGYTTYRGS